MRGKEACRNSGHVIQDHFEEFLGMVEIALSQEQKKLEGGE